MLPRRELMDLETLIANLSAASSPYAVIGCLSTDSDETVARCYRSLCLRLHPDKTGHPAAIGLFGKVTAAYEAIRDARASSPSSNAAVILFNIVGDHNTLVGGTKLFGPSRCLRCENQIDNNGRWYCETCQHADEQHRCLTCGSPSNDSQCAVCMYTKPGRCAKFGCLNATEKSGDMCEKCRRAKVPKKCSRFGCLRKVVSCASDYSIDDKEAFCPLHRSQ